MLDGSLSSLSICYIMEWDGMIGISFAYKPDCSDQCLYTFSTLGAQRASFGLPLLSRNICNPPALTREPEWPFSLPGLVLSQANFPSQLPESPRLPVLRGSVWHIHPLSHWLHVVHIQAPQPGQMQISLPVHTSRHLGQLKEAA